ncbi:MAG: Leader peptidase PppA [Bryobacteraceae bacterium]|nr:Leader peptidase PppA [Bryobacteraceae bacterium]
MMEALAAGFFGLLTGSFLNVCIYRLPRDLSVVTPRSHCTSCERTIAWYDNVPVLSYILLGGKCRHCRAPFSIRYPIVELLTGVLFFLSVYSRGPNPVGLKLCVFSAIMVDLIFTDLADRILPDEFTLGGAAAGVVLAAFTPPASSVALLFLPSSLPGWIHSVAEAALGSAVCAGLLWLTGRIYQLVRRREGLGFGDVKMLLTVGAFLGLPGALLTVFFGSVLGALIGALYIYLSKEDMTYELPFGSFLGIAALIVGLFGEQITAWYWKLG